MVFRYPTANLLLSDSFWSSLKCSTPQPSRNHVHVQLLNCVWLFGPHGLQHTRRPCFSLSPRVLSNSRPLSRWCHPTISCSVVPSPPALNLSQHQGLSQWVASLYQWQEYWSSSISPSNIYSGLISFRIDLFDLLAVQGTLKSLQIWELNHIEGWAPKNWWFQTVVPEKTLE